MLRPRQTCARDCPASELICLPPPGRCPRPLGRAPSTPAAPPRVLSSLFFSHVSCSVPSSHSSLLSPRTAGEALGAAIWVRTFKEHISPGGSFQTRCYLARRLQRGNWSSGGMQTQPAYRLRSRCLPVSSASSGPCQRERSAVLFSGALPAPARPQPTVCTRRTFT